MLLLVTGIAISATLLTIAIRGIIRTHKETQVWRRLQTYIMAKNQPSPLSPEDIKFLTATRRD